MSRKKHSILELLKKAGISKEDFEFYVHQFASNRHPYLVPYGKHEWRRGKGDGITDTQIAKHLAETSRYGVTGGEYTDYFVIDIDIKDPTKAGKRDFYRRMEIARELFPAGLLIQSSSSGGVHLYQFLLEPVLLDDLIQLVSIRLHFRGIQAQAGKYEIDKLKHGLRLPLGKDSYILDPDTLLRSTNSKHEDIFRIQYTVDRLLLLEVFNTEEIRYKEEQNKASISTPLFSSSTPISTDEAAKAASTPKSTKKNQRFIEFCEYYLKNGLEEFGTRYYITTRLIIYAFTYLKYDEEEVYDFVSDWLARKNNGYSKDWNKNAENVLKILSHQVRYFARRRNGQRRGLSEKEVRLIIEQEELTYDEQAWLFDLFSFIKGHSNGRRKINLSSKLLSRFRGASNATYTQRRDFAIKLGIIRKIKGQMPDAGLACLYEHTVDFDWSRDDFQNIDTAIATLLSESEIRDRYSDYRSRRLLRHKREIENNTSERSYA